MDPGLHVRSLHVAQENQARDLVKTVIYDFYSLVKVLLKSFFVISFFVFLFVCQRYVSSLSFYHHPPHN